MSLWYVLDSFIKEEVELNQTIAIYPLGRVGLSARNILVDRYGQEPIVIDNGVAGYNRKAITIDEFERIDDDHITIILCTSDTGLNNELAQDLYDRGLKAKIKNILDMRGKVVKYPSGKNFQEIKKLCAVKKVIGYELIRVGNEYDGGYVMLDDFKDKHIAYSFGIGDNVDWDECISDRGIDVYCYDHTIDGLPKENVRLHFNKTGIAGTDSLKENLLSMNTILYQNGHENEKKLILKMDVEGAEWDFINSVSYDILNQFSQMTFELHGLTDDKNREKIVEALSKLNVTHQVVWIHGNNTGGGICSDGIIMPNLLEVTYVNKSEYTFESVKYDCPTILDMPNAKGYADLPLLNWGEL